MEQDREHLKLLAIFHYVAGGMAGLFACIPLIHLTVGLGLIVGGLGGQEPGLAFVGVVLMLVAALIIALGWTLAILMIISGRNLNACKHHTFCLVVACVECLFMPFGTVLGVFTIIVLMRPSVKELFGAGQ